MEAVGTRLHHCRKPARIDQKEKKKKKEKARRGNWRLSDLMGGDVAATGGLCVMNGRVRHTRGSCNNTIKSTRCEGKKLLTYPILMRVLVCGQCGGMLVGGCTGRMPVATSSCNTDTFKQINKCIVAQADTVGCLVYADQNRYL